MNKQQIKQKQIKLGLKNNYKYFLSIVLISTILILLLLINIDLFLTSLEREIKIFEREQILEIYNEPIKENISVKGLATWYDYDLRTEDQKCKVNDCYSMYNLTCASRDFERGSILEVKYGDKTIQCRVNDYGPELWTGKDLDLSSYAFGQLAPFHLGFIEVEITKIK